MTAEAALALPALVLVWVACVLGIVVLMAQVRCLDAAREVARAAARGESSHVLEEVVDAIGPPGAELATERDGRYVFASVTLRLDLPTGFGRRLSVVSATAVAVQEPRYPTLGAQASGPAWQLR